MYGGAIGFFDVVGRELADDVYAERAPVPLRPRHPGVATPLSYYDDNWVWFGMALHLDELPNLDVTQE